MAASGQMNLLILGAGMLGRDVYDIAASLRVFKKISFLDDAAVGDDIIGKCSDLFKFRDEYPLAFIAIGDNKIRQKYAELLREYHFLFQALFLRLLIFRLELYSVMVSLFCLWRVWGRLQ